MFKKFWTTTIALLLTIAIIPAFSSIGFAQTEYIDIDLSSTVNTLFYSGNSSNTTNVIVYGEKNDGIRELITTGLKYTIADTNIAIAAQDGVITEKNIGYTFLNVSYDMSGVHLEKSIIITVHEGPYSNGKFTGQFWEDSKDVSLNSGRTVQKMTGEYNATNATLIGKNNSIVEFWFYDIGSSVCRICSNRTLNGADLPWNEFVINTGLWTIDSEGQWMSTPNYRFGIKPTNMYDDTKATDIKQTKGWHQVVYDQSTAGKFKMFLDGKLVYKDDNLKGSNTLQYINIIKTSTYDLYVSDWRSYNVGVTAEPMLEVSKTPTYINVGSSEPFNITVNSNLSNNENFNFKCSDETVATVSTNGDITAHKIGNVTIEATMKNLPYVTKNIMVATIGKSFSNKKKVVADFEGEFNGGKFSDQYGGNIGRFSSEKSMEGSKALYLDNSINWGKVKYRIFDSDETNVSPYDEKHISQFWFYDSLEDTNFAILRYLFGGKGNSDDHLSIQVGTKKDISADYYVADTALYDFEWKTVENSGGYTATLAKRSEGWHQIFVDTLSGNKVKIYLDGILIIDYQLRGNYSSLYSLQVEVQENSQKATKVYVDNFTYYKEKMNIVYLGGSITAGSAATTHGNTWTWKTYSELKKMYPNKDVTYNNSGIGGTGSDYALETFQNRVLNFDPDLVFIEFAVNDRFSQPQIVKNNISAMVKKLLKLEKVPNIIFVYAATRQFDACDTIYEEVAKEFNIPSINLQEYFKTEIKNGNFTLDDVFPTGDDVHPNDLGHTKYADCIMDKLVNQNEKYLGAFKISPINYNLSKGQNNITINLFSKDSVVANFVGAIYDGNKLVDMIPFETVNYVNNEDSIISDNYSLLQGQTMKVFVFESLDNIKPLVASSDIK